MQFESIFCLYSFFPINKYNRFYLVLKISSLPFGNGEVGMI